MRRLNLALASVLALMPSLSQAAHTTGSYSGGNGQSLESVCATWSGTTLGSGTVVPCASSSGGGAVTAVSGAYAAGSIVDIGTGASPAANTVNARLASLLTTLGAPLQTGGIIGNTSFGATQSGSWNVGITGSVGVTGTFWPATQPVSAASLPLPAGAATAASVQALASSTSFSAVTPNDGTPLSTIPRAIYVGGAGNLTIKGSDGVSATLIVTAGQLLPIGPSYVMATGTTATGIVAFK